MGIDCSDIGSILHWGIPSNIEEYVQETGRAGRDGRQATANIFAGKGGQHSTKKMKAYIDNDSACRRKFMFENFLK